MTNSCPQCQREYGDTMLFCLYDGTRLVAYESLPHVSKAELNEPTTQILSQSNSQAEPNTIAVLPFLNLSRSEDNDYFCDGLAEELLNVLSKIRGLRVAARTSAFSFKGKDATVADIGRILNVASILEGSIRTAGERLRISVQLINVDNGFQLWSETYDRTMDDIFAVQDDIAGSVVEELRIRLLGKEPTDQESRHIIEEVREAAEGRAVDAEAQRLMMLGRYFLDRSTREDTLKAIDYFDRAIQRDPNFVLCLAELSRAYSIEAGRGWIPVAEGFARSREAVNKALAIMPDLGEAHAQLGRIKAAYDWDLTGAQASYRRAIELSPGNAETLDGASILAYKLGRLDEALELSRRVLVRDPLRTAFWHNLGLTCHAAGLLGEAERAFARALDFAPNRTVSSAMLALVLADQGRFEEAAERAASEPDEFWRLWCGAIYRHTSGDKTGADDDLTEILEKHREGNAYQIGEIYSMRGDADLAFMWLNTAIEQRDAGVTHAKVSPRLQPVRNDKRWPDLMAKIGL